MKRCPKCSADYFDNMLEFCLEDGARLTLLSDTAARTATETKAVGQATTPTVAFTTKVPPDTLEVPGNREVETVVTHAAAIAPQAKSRSEVLEYAAVGVALAHNWWQWIYLEDQYVSTIASYVLSANFLMWLLLLAAGTALGLISLKQSERKGNAYLSLVILAINLILFIVPRR